MSLPLLALGSAIADPILQGFQNRANRNFTVQMYNRQRQDALSDWQMQNEYNSPTQQMTRLKAAGLNPNLIYGNGSTAVTSTQSVRSSSPGSYQGKAPSVDLSAIYQQKALELETDKTKSAITVNDADKTLKAAQTAATLANAGYVLTKNQRERLGLALDNTLFDTNVDMKKAALKNMEAKTTFTLAENERQAAKNAADLKIAAERVLQIRAQTATTQAEKEKINQMIENLKKSYEIQELDRAMKANGLWWSDPFHERAVGILIGNLQDSQDKKDAANRIGKLIGSTKFR